MREHMGLFRGKRCDNGEWVSGFYVRADHHWHNYGIHKDWIICGASANGGWFALRNKHPVKSDTVGECTGLKDKNGKLIFEGDVTKDEWYREWEIVGCPGGFAALRCAEEWRLMGPAAGLSDAQNASWLEGTHVIIGNIHDNGELLKGGE